MADRQLPELRTRLRLDTTDIDRAKKTARDFLATLDQKVSTKGLDEFAAKADRVGDKLNRNVTLPALAAGAAATKLAYDFNTTFTQMQTLAGVTAGEVEGLKERVKELAVETGRSPDELARALYFIRSSGVDAATAMQVLDLSAKSAAGGLGDAAAVADALTSAINTYGAENLTAARAADVLNAAVQEGKGEASEFAPQLGRLLPVANNLGVSFDQVAGSLAFLTKTSGDTSLASAQLGGILAALLDPTVQGRKQLDLMGLSANKLRESVAQNGLLPTLEDLSQKLGGNKDALGQLFEDQQAIQGFLGLTQNADEAAKSVDAVTQSAGFLADGFAKVNETDEFKFTQALQELSVTAIDVGTMLIPLLADVAETGGDVLDLFSNLPEPVQTALLGLVGAAAVLGPLAKGAGFAASGVSALIKAAKASRPAVEAFQAGLAGTAAQGSGAAASLGGLISTVGATPLAMGVAVAGIAGLLYALSQMETKAEAAEQAARNLAEAAESTGKTVDEVFREQLAKTLAGQYSRNDDGDLFLEGGLDQIGSPDTIEGLDMLAKVGLDPETIAAGLQGTEAEFEAFMERVRALSDEYAQEYSYAGMFGPDDLDAEQRGVDKDEARIREEAIAALGRFRTQAVLANKDAAKLDEIQKSLDVDTDKTTDATDRQTGSLDGLGGAADASADDLATLAAEARDLFNAQQAAADSADAVVEAQEAVAEARTQGAEAVADALAAVSDAEDSLVDAQAASRDATLSLADARRQAAEELEDLRIAAAGAVVSESEAQTALLRAEQEARDLDTADPIARREAADKVARAQQALDEAKDGKGDAAQALADAQAKGIEGSDAVVAAQERVADAADAEREAQERVGDASARVAEVRKEAAEKVDEATRRVTDAQLSAIDAAATLAEKTDGAAASNAVLVEGLNGLAATLDPANPLRQRLAGFAAELAALQQAEGPTITIDDKGRLSQSIASLDGYRAQGGPVYPGRAYAVNENPNAIVPEVFVPDVAGRIVHANDGPARGALPDVQVVVNVGGDTSAQTVALVRREAEKAVTAGIRNAVAEVNR